MSEQREQPKGGAASSSPGLGDDTPPPPPPPSSSYPTVMPPMIPPRVPWGVTIPSWRPPPPPHYGLPYTFYGAAPVPTMAPPPLSDAATPPWKLPHRPTAGIKFNVAAKTTPIPVTLAGKSMSAAPRPNPPITTTTTTNGQWPPSLRMYVDRCFSLCRTDTDRDKTEVALKSRIQVAIKAGNLYSHDWSNEPLLNVVEAPPVSTKKEQRAKRFQAEHNAMKQPDIQAKKMRKSALLAMAEEGIDWDEFTIIGTCQNLEKPYLRLTSAPDPATVRPLPILKKTLDWLKKKWKESRDYNYVCDQFKSLRQDLTVQRIRNEFTVQVYEIHARIALEKGDLGEYNQCQTQLKLLYENGISGNALEFLAYRILYLLHTRNRQEMNSLLAQLSPEQKRNPAVKHALDTRSAMALNDYYRFFQLYQEAPNMGGYLMDFYVKRERMSALSTICKAYRPTIKVSYLTEILAFDNIPNALQFLTDAGVSLLENNALLDTKASLMALMSN